MRLWTKTYNRIYHADEREKKDILPKEWHMKWENRSLEKLKF